MMGPSTSGSRQRSIVTCASDIFVALAAERDGAGLGELAGDLQDLLLRALDLGEAHRALRLEVVAQHFRGALRHVLEDLLLQSLVRALQGEQQLLRRNLAQ